MQPAGPLETKSEIKDAKEENKSSHGESKDNDSKWWSRLRLTDGEQKFLRRIWGYDQDEPHDYSYKTLQKDYACLYMSVTGRFDDPPNLPPGNGDILAEDLLPLNTVYILYCINQRKCERSSIPRKFEDDNAEIKILTKDMSKIKTHVKGMVFVSLDISSTKYPAKVTDALKELAEPILGKDLTEVNSEDFYNALLISYTPWAELFWEHVRPEAVASQVKLITGSANRRSPIHTKQSTTHDAKENEPLTPSSDTPDTCPICAIL